MTPKALLITATALVLIVGSFAGGYLLGQTAEVEPGHAAQDRQEDHDTAWIEEDLLRNFEFVQDALSRWARENGMSVERILDDWSPQAMLLPDRACVQLVLRRPSTGGAPPVYCYSLDASGWPTTQLIYEQSERH